MVETDFDKEFLLPGGFKGSEGSRHVDEDGERTHAVRRSVG